MNDTRGYGSKKKRFTVFLNRWTKALNVRIQSSEWKNEARFRGISSLQLLLAFHCCWQWWAHSPGDTYCCFNKVASIFIYIHFLFHAYRYLSIWDFAPHESALFQYKKTLYVPIKVCELLVFNLTSFKLQFRAKCLDNKLKK